MYRIMIVDDEDEVREGIRQKTDWAACGFELVGDFGNGRDALEAMDALKPDVLITDINMPFMDGLALAGHIAERYRNVKVAIITGYEDFQYAQQAIKLKVNDYMLKPVNAKEFTAYLEQIRKVLDEERANLEDVSRLRSQLNQSLPLLKERFLERMATSRMNPEEIGRRLDYFGISLPGPSYLALVSDLDDFSHAVSEPTDDDMELLRFAAFNIFQEIFEKENGGIVFRTRDDKIGILFSGTAGQIEFVSQTLAEQAASGIGRFLKLTVSIGIGRTYFGLQQLSNSFQEALSALDYRFLLGKNKIIAIDDVESASALDTIRYNEWENKLLSALKTAHRETAAQVLREWMEDLRNSTSSVEACYGTIYKILVSLMNLAAEAGLEDRQLFGETPFVQVSGMKTLDEVEGWLKALCRQVISFLAEKRTNVAHSQMQLAESYIREHYADEKLSLNQLCSHLFISISYFSALFKQHTGETFVEYLTRVRLERAKELLTSTPLKAYDIAARVGYGDPQYFSVIFKRHTGMTPKEFRTAERGSPA